MSVIYDICLKNIQAWNGAFIFGTVADQLLTKLEASGGFNYIKSCWNKLSKQKSIILPDKMCCHSKIPIKF